MFVFLLFVTLCSASFATSLKPEDCPKLLSSMERENYRSQIYATVDANDYLFEMIWRPSSLTENAAFKDYRHRLQVRQLAGEDLNRRDARGRTPLIHAAAAENKALVFALIINGVRVDLRDESGMSAGDYALLLRRTTPPPDLWYVERDLLVHGLYVGPEVSAALASSNHAQIEKLLVRGLNPNFYDFHLRKSMLAHASGKGDLELMRLLLRFGADPNFRLPNQIMHIYPLGAAAGANKIKAIELLLEHGVNINAGGNYKNDINPVRTAIHDYSQRGNDRFDKFGLLDWLLEHGADPDANISESGLAHPSLIEFIRNEFAGDPERRRRVVILLKQHDRLKLDPQCVCGLKSQK